MAPGRGFIQNWLQTNWELFIEGMMAYWHLAIYISEYGKGAINLNYGYDDWIENFVSRRAIYPHKLPTHSVVARPKNPKQMLKCLVSKEPIDLGSGLILQCFCTLRENKPVSDVPFDCVQLQNGSGSVFLNCEDVHFYLVRNT